MFHWHTRAPAKAALQLLIGITLVLPFRGATARVENRWDLPFRPGGVFRPLDASAIGQPIWHTNGPEAFHRLARSEKLPRGRQIVIHNVKRLAIDSRLQTG